MRNALSASGGLFILMLGVSSPAFAHATLLNSTPAANATIAAPKRIELTFSEKITPAFSGFDLEMGDSMKVEVTTTISSDGKTIIGAPQGMMMSGAYKLNWHAVATDDGHRTEGTLSFTVK